jgi:hypothetical protein
MMDSRISCKQIYAAVDQHYTALASADYHLNLLVSPSRVQLALLDTSRMSYVGVKEYEASAGQFYAFPDLLSVLEKEEEWLGLNGIRQKLAFFSEKNLLVPQLFAREIEGELLTKHHFSLEKEEELERFKVPGMDAELLQAIPKALAKWAQNRSKERFSLVQVFLQQAQLSIAKIRISVLGNTLLLGVFENKALLFYNTFPFRTNEEAAYFVLFALQQNQIDPLKAAVEIDGDIEPGGELLSLLRKYILSVQINEKVQGYTLSPALQGNAQYRYLTLYSLYHCA